MTVLAAAVAQKDDADGQVCFFLLLFYWRRPVQVCGVNVLPSRSCRQVGADASPDEFVRQVFPRSATMVEAQKKKEPQEVPTVKTNVPLSVKEETLETEGAKLARSAVRLLADCRTGLNASATASCRKEVWSAFFRQCEGRTACACKT